MELITRISSLSTASNNELQEMRPSSKNELEAYDVNMMLRLQMEELNQIAAANNSVVSTDNRSSNTAQRESERIDVNAILRMQIEEMKKLSLQTSDSANKISADWQPAESQQVESQTVESQPAESEPAESEPEENLIKTLETITDEVQAVRTLKKFDGAIQNAIQRGTARSRAPMNKRCSFLSSSVVGEPVPVFLRQSTTTTTKNDSDNNGNVSVLKKPGNRISVGEQQPAEMLKKTIGSVADEAHAVRFMKQRESALQRAMGRSTAPLNKRCSFLSSSLVAEPSALMPLQEDHAAGVLQKTFDTLTDEAHAVRFMKKRQSAMKRVLDRGVTRSRAPMNKTCSFQSTSLVDEPGSLHSRQQTRMSSRSRDISLALSALKSDYSTSNEDKSYSTEQVSSWEASALEASVASISPADLAKLKLFVALTSGKGSAALLEGSTAYPEGSAAFLDASAAYPDESAAFLDERISLAESSMPDLSDMSESEFTSVHLDRDSFLHFAEANTALGARAEEGSTIVEEQLLPPVGSMEAPMLSSMSGHENTERPSVAASHEDQEEFSTDQALLNMASIASLNGLSDQERSELLLALRQSADEAASVVDEPMGSRMSELSESLQREMGSIASLQNMSEEEKFAIMLALERSKEGV